MPYAFSLKHFLIYAKNLYPTWNVSLA